MVEVVLSERMRESDLRVFPRKVRSMMTDLVNKHGVRWRMAKDGNHVFLYGGDTDIHPYKVSSQRSEESTVKSLTRWALRTIPSFGQADQSELIVPAPVGDVVKPEILEQAVHQSGGYLVDGGPSVLSVPEKEPGFEVFQRPDAEREWVVINDRTSEWLYWDRAVEPHLIRCMADDYTSENRMGVHLHEAKHTGAAEVAIRKGVKSRQDKAAKRRLETEQSEVLVHEAVRVLAEHYGIALTGEKDQEIATLRRQVEQQEKEIEELRAKIQLIKEASTL